MKVFSLSLEFSRVALLPEGKKANGFQLAIHVGQASCLTPFI
jgi:hypothetical protein